MKLLQLMPTVDPRGGGPMEGVRQRGLRLLEMGHQVEVAFGRLHVKKGCDLLVEAFARVAADEPRLHLLMAEPDQTGWVSQLKARA
jgi:hypothetical protein